MASPKRLSVNAGVAPPAVLTVHLMLSLRLPTLALTASLLAAYGVAGAAPVTHPTYHNDGAMTVDGVRYASLEAYVASDAFRRNGATCTTADVVALPHAVPLIASDCTDARTVINPSYDVGEITVPVVFHVVTKTNGTGKVDAAHIASQLDELNQVYNPPGAVAGLRFVLANRDPDGKPTSGVEYVANDAWFADPGPGVANPMRQALSWNPARYMNIFTNDGGGSLGYTLLPFGTLNADDGITLQWNVVGRNPPLGAPYDLGTVAAHEVGHYFGLLHTFNNGCGSASAPYTTGDLIADTTPTAQPVFNCGPAASGCSFGSQIAPADNFMDYSVDVCRMRFSPEQFNRMRCATYNYRPALLQRAPVAEFSTTVTSLAVNFTNASIADGAAVAFHWDFGDGTTSSDKTPTHTYAAAGSYNVTLEVVAGALAASKSQAVIAVDDPTQASSDGGCQSNAPAGSALAMVVAALGLVRRRTHRRA